MGRTVIRKGGKVLVYENGKLIEEAPATVQTKTSIENKTDKPKNNTVITEKPKTMPEVTASTSDMPKPVVASVPKASNSDVKASYSNVLDVVGNCKNAIKSEGFTYEMAANCIVGEIRAIYFGNLVKPIGSYDIEMLMYMDKILFNTLVKIIEGIIRYGSGTVSIDLVKKIIKNAIDAVEFQTDVDSAYHVIDRVYAEF